MLTTHLGAWQVAQNTCKATLAVDRPRAITISLEWTRDPGPTENEHLETVLPDIVESALEAVESLAATGEAIRNLIAAGKVRRVGIRDGFFVYAATDADSPDDTLAGGHAQQPV